MAGSVVHSFCPTNACQAQRSTHLVLRRQLPLPAILIQGLVQAVGQVEVVHLLLLDQAQLAESQMGKGAAGLMT